MTTIGGGRFELDREIRGDDAGARIGGKDLQSGKAVEVVVFAGGAAHTQRRARFLAGAQRLVGITHRGLARVLESGEHEGAAFMAIEAPKGVALSERLGAENPGTAGDLIRLTGQVLDALKALHDAGLCHGNLSANQIVITGRRGFDSPKLTGFLLEPTDAAPEASPGTPLERALGVASVPPERLRTTPETLERRDDLYGLGMVLYAAVAGRLPVPGRHVAIILSELIDGHRRPLAEVRPETPAEFATAVDRAIHTDPAARFDKAQDLRKAIMAAGFRAPALRPLPLRSPELVEDDEAPAPEAPAPEAPTPETATPEAAPQKVFSTPKAKSKTADRIRSRERTLDGGVTSDEFVSAATRAPAVGTPKRRKKVVRKPTLVGMPASELMANATSPAPTPAPTPAPSPAAPKVTADSPIVEEADSVILEISGLPMPQDAPVEDDANVIEMGDDDEDEGNVVIEKGDDDEDEGDVVIEMGDDDGPELSTESPEAEPAFAPAGGLDPVNSDLFPRFGRTVDDASDTVADPAADKPEASAQAGPAHDDGEDLVLGDGGIGRRELSGGDDDEELEIGDGGLGSPAPRREPTAPIDLIRPKQVEPPAPAAAPPASGGWGRTIFASLAALVLGALGGWAVGSGRVAGVPPALGPLSVEAPSAALPPEPPMAEPDAGVDAGWDAGEPALPEESDATLEEALDGGADSVVPEEGAGDESTPEPTDGAEAVEINLRRVRQGANITLDGERVVGRTIIITDAETHTIRVRARGYRTWEREVTREDAGDLRVELRPRRSRRDDEPEAEAAP